MQPRNITWEVQRTFWGRKKKKKKDSEELFRSYLEEKKKKKKILITFKIPTYPELYLSIPANLIRD